jgi:hypothetical protein
MPFCQLKLYFRTLDFRGCLQPSIWGQAVFQAGILYPPSSVLVSFPWLIICGYESAKNYSVLQSCWYLFDMGEIDEFWWRGFRRMAAELVRQGPLVARHPLPGGGRLLPLLVPSLLLLLLLTGLLLG